jgi:hypothetical protein
MRNTGIVLARCALVMLSAGTCMGLVRMLVDGAFAPRTDLTDALGFALAVLLLYAATRAMTPTPPAA